MDERSPKDKNYTPRRASRKKAQQRKIRRMVTIGVIALLVIAILAVVIKFAVGKGDKKKGGDEPKTKVSKEETTVDPNAPVATAKVLSTGDVLIHKLLLEASADGSGYSFDKHFRAVKDEISAADLAVANLEVTLGEGNYQCYPTFKSPDSVADALKNAGFDFLVSANNHCYDTSFDGLKRTAKVVRDKGFGQTGTKADLDQKDYEIVDVNGIKIGIINYAEETTCAAGTKALNGIKMAAEANDYVNSFNAARMDEFYKDIEGNIASMKKDGAEAIMLYIHWGVEYALTQNTNQSTVAQKMCDMGVDVIIGGHPHVIQPAAVLTSTTDPSHKTFCIYSVGNLLSNQRREFMGSACPTGHSEDAIFVYTTFTKYGDGRVELSAVDYSPLWINRYAEGGSYVYEITNVSDPSKVSKNSDGAAASLERTKKLVDEGFKSFAG
ncbi:MAG: CapA family protein [Oscillospiraceae bacterium]|nr:CapA family protein [Candidatus Limimonas egerieequi]